MAACFKNNNGHNNDHTMAHVFSTFQVAESFYGPLREITDVSTSENRQLSAKLR